MAAAIVAAAAAPTACVTSSIITTSVATTLAMVRPAASVLCMSKRRADASGKIDRRNEKKDIAEVSHVGRPGTEFRMRNTSWLTPG